MADPDTDSAEVVLYADGDQAVVMGQPDAVDAFLSALPAPAEVQPLSDKHVAAVATALAGMSGAASVAASASGRYLQLTAESAAWLHSYGAIQSGGAILGVVRAPGGGFAHMLKFNPSHVNPAQLASLGSLAGTVALQVQLAQLNKAIDGVGFGVDRLLADRRSEMLGDVVGAVHSIDYAQSVADELGRLPAGVWDSIDELQGPIARSIEVARARVTQMAASLTTLPSVPRRQAELGKVIDERELEFWLTMLLVAERSLIQWRALHAQILREQDVEAAQHAIRSATQQQATWDVSDSAMISTWSAAIAALSRVTGLDGVREATVSQIFDSCEYMRDCVNAFALARSLQPVEWDRPEAPNLGTALATVTDQAGHTAKRGLEAVQDGFQSLRGLRSRRHGSERAGSSEVGASTDPPAIEANDSVEAESTWVTDASDEREPAPAERPTPRGRHLRRPFNGGR